VPSNNTRNCRSDAKKPHELIHESQTDVLLLSETWFPRDTPKSIMLDIASDDFSSLHVVWQVGDGKPSRRGGLRDRHGLDQPMGWVGLDPAKN